MDSTHLALLDSAREYRERGLFPVPVPSGCKGPVIKDWPSLRLTCDELPKHFGGDGNIGLLLGEPSGWLIDVDLDCPEAIELAPEYLPATTLKSGREGHPGSHWWFRSPGAKTAQYRDPRTKTMMVELRSTGAQTIVGPSTHPEGGRYDILSGEPAEVPVDVLTAAVDALARAIVRVRYGVPGTVQSERSSKSEIRDESEVLRRARAYLAKIPSAVSGNAGHDQTYAAATALVHGFGLDEKLALYLLLAEYNPRCQPPWTEKELSHKIRDAATKPHDRPAGWLRDRAFDDEPFHSAVIRMQPSLPSASTQQPCDPGLFPHHLLSVPGLVGDLMAFNLQSAPRRQPVLALAGALCLQSVLAGRKVCDDRGNRTNIYCVGVAPSGAGKDHARKLNREILLQSNLDDLEGSEELASDAGLISAVHNSPAALFQLDEFGRFLRTVGDASKSPHLFNVVSALLKLYTSAGTVFKGKAYADPAQSKRIVQPCVTVYGTTVPEHLYAGLTSDSLSDGLMARLLVFEGEPSPARQPSTMSPVPDAIVKAAEWWGRQQPGTSAGGHPSPRVVQTTKEASARFAQLAAQADRIIGQTDPPVGASVWARAEEKACRLALIYACSANREHPVIDTAAAEWACELAEYLTRRMLYLAHEWVADGFFDAMRKRVMRVIKAAGGEIFGTDLCRRTQWLKPRERKEILESLELSGEVRLELVPSGTRPATRYVAL